MYRSSLYCLKSSVESVQNTVFKFGNGTCHGFIVAPRVAEVQTPHVTLFGSRVFTGEQVKLRPSDGLSPNLRGVSIEGVYLGMDMQAMGRQGRGRAWCSHVPRMAATPKALGRTQKGFPLSLRGPCPHLDPRLPASRTDTGAASSQPALGQQAADQHLRMQLPCRLCPPQITVCFCFDWEVGREGEAWLGVDAGLPPHSGLPRLHSLMMPQWDYAPGRPQVLPAAHRHWCSWWLWPGYAEL